MRRLEAVSLAQARRIALAAQGFAGKPSEGIATWPRLAKAIDTMGLLQIDSVNVLVRSHYLPVFARVGAYDVSTLDARTHGKAKRRYFEYWAHEASFLPLELYPLFHWKMERARNGNGTYSSLHAWADENRPYVDTVRAEVTAKGAIGVSGLDDPGTRSGHWWGWSKGKYALEYLFDRGEVTTASRQGFERIYDLTERVIPAPALAAPAPAAADAIRALLDRSGRALGIATEIELRDYFRLPVADTKIALAELVEAGNLRPCAVKGWTQPVYLHADARLPHKVEATALLSPFDPLVWERQRAERLFDFRYRIEIYTPAPKRVHGYYVLPFLCGDRLAARVCLKADRQTRTLLVNSAFAEAHAEHDGIASALASELRRMAAWLGLEAVAPPPRGDLAPALTAALSRA